MKPQGHEEKQRHGHRSIVGLCRGGNCSNWDTFGCELLGLGKRILLLMLLILLNAEQCSIQYLDCEMEERKQGKTNAYAT